MWLGNTIGIQIMMDSHPTTTEHEVAQLIIETLRLERSPHEILPEEPLFGDGLGLDSIDALEIALAIFKSYGFALKSDESRAHRVFASLRSLTRYIDTHRTK
jgi:acyl carrier protein